MICIVLEGDHVDVILLVPGFIERYVKCVFFRLLWKQHNVNQGQIFQVTGLR